MAIIKTNEEINALRMAAKLGENCFEYIYGIIKPGMTEIKISEYIYNFFINNGVSKLSFETIVGSGKNSQLIHSTPTERIIEDNDIILLDIGCVLNGYCSDMSRTIFVGKPSNKQKEIYNLVYEAYNNAICNIKPGNKANEADSFARDIIKKSGFDFAHALGHGVGQVVHEDPLISPKKDTLLEENMVFSVEPGIYIEDEFGIRIEDVGVLTENGLQMFTTASKEMVVL